MTDRRSFLRGASVLMGHAALGQVMTAFAAAPRKASYFTESEMRTLRALVDVILPATDSPAASAADTHYFIDLAIPACAKPRGAEDLSRRPERVLGHRRARRAGRNRWPMLKARAAQDMRAALRPVVLQDSQGLHADRLLPLGDRRHAGAGVRTRSPAASRATCRSRPTRKRGRSDGHVQSIRRDRRRLRHVGRLGREGTHAKRASRRWCSSAAATSATSTDYTTALKDPWQLPHNNRADQRGPRGAAHPVDALSIRPVDQAAFLSTTRKYPYEQAQPFNWYRGYQVGGRSLHVGAARVPLQRSRLRGQPEAKAWASTGRSATPTSRRGTTTWRNSSAPAARTPGLPQLPKQILQPPFEMNALEKHIKREMAKAFTDRKLICSATAVLSREHNGRGPCQGRNQCARGCPYSAYFSSNGVTLPAAAATGNLTLQPDSIVHSLIYDEAQAARDRRARDRRATRSRPPSISRAWCSCAPRR